MEMEIKLTVVKSEYSVRHHLRVSSDYSYLLQWVQVGKLRMVNLMT